jgi:hypothetical protein
LRVIQIHGGEEQSRLDVVGLVLEPLLEQEAGVAEFALVPMLPGLIDGIRPHQVLRLSSKADRTGRARAMSRAWLATYVAETECERPES